MGDRPPSTPTFGLMILNVRRPGASDYQFGLFPTPAENSGVRVWPRVLLVLSVMLLFSASIRGGPIQEPRVLPTPSTQLALRAEPIPSDSGEELIQRYRVQWLPLGHGYEPGRLIGLFSRVNGLTEPRPIGAAEVIEAHEYSIDLVAIWIAPGHETEIAEISEIPPGHHFGNKIGQMLAGQNDSLRGTINMGSAHGVMVGDMYSVLGDAYTDANVGGRSLGRRSIGLIQVVESEPGGQTADVEVIQGSAPHGAYIRFAGHEAVQPLPVVKILITRFHGDRGDAYSQSLRQALERELGHNHSSDIRIVTTERIVNVVDGSDAQATRIGRDFRVDVVIWGSASSVGANISVRPRVTFIRANQREAQRQEEQQEEARLWNAVKMDAERVFRDQPDEVSRRVQGIVSYLAGLMYYHEFENSVERSYGRAAAYFKLAILNGDSVDASNAKTPLFYCLERMGDWIGAEQVARAITRDGKNSNNGRRQSLGLFLQARLALATGSPMRALDLARKAARLLEASDVERLHAIVMDLIADVYFLRDEFDEALRIARQNVVVFERLKDLRSSASSMGSVARIMTIRGDWDGAMLLFQRSAAIGDRIGDKEVWARSMMGIADIYISSGRADHALRILQRDVMPVLDQLGAVRERAVAREEIAQIYYYRGSLDAAMNIWQEVSLVFKGLGDVQSYAVVVGKIADIHQLRGNFEEAIRIRNKDELPIYRRLGRIRATATTMAQVADMYYIQGDLDEALRIRQDEVLPVYERLGDVRGRAITFGQIADIYADRGRLDEALRIHEQEGLPVFERLGDIREYSFTMGRIADIYSRLGRFDEAILIYKNEVFAVDEKLELRRDLVVDRMSLALVILKRNKIGDRAEARALLKAALVDAKAMNIPAVAKIEKLLNEHPVRP